jgi:hypothetical protein
LAPPVKGKMFKGLCVCYSVIVATYFSVAISGYWAFGNAAGATVLTNYIRFNDIGEMKLLLPKWFFLMTNILILLQVFGLTAVRTLNLFGIYIFQFSNSTLEDWFCYTERFSGEVCCLFTFRSFIYYLKLLVHFELNYLSLRQSINRFQFIFISSPKF